MCGCGLEGMGYGKKLIWVRNSKVLSVVFVYFRFGVFGGCKIIVAVDVYVSNVEVGIVVGDPVC